MVNLEAVRSDAADEEPLRLQSDSGIVDRRSIDLWLADGESQLRQVRDLVDLPAGGLEQDGGADPSMDVAQSALAVRVKCSGVRLVAGDVGFDRGVQARFSKLPKHYGSETGDIQRGGTRRVINGSRRAR